MTLGCLASLVCGSSLFAQSTIEVQETSVTTRLWAVNDECESDHKSEDCFEEIMFKADSLDDFPILSEATVEDVDTILHGMSFADATLDDDGLTIELDTNAPGQECCLGDDFFYFHARTEAEITFTLPEDAYVRIGKTRVNTFYDPQKMGTANGSSSFTLLNADTEEVIEQNSYGLSEHLLEAGDYTIQMDTYAWTSCDCTSSLFQGITISDRPVPSVVVVENHTPDAYVRIDGTDTAADKSVTEIEEVDTLEDLPAYVTHYFDEKFSWDTYRGSALANALVSPNRFTLWSNTRADSHHGSSGGFEWDQTWDAITYFDFQFDLTEPSKVTMDWCMDREEIVDFGQSSGETTCRIRLAHLTNDGDVILFDESEDTIGTVCDEISLDLEPGQYLIWCDSTAGSQNTSGASTRRSHTELDMLFTPTKQPNPADVNGDGQVNGADLGSLIAAWGPCKGCPEDLNGDGMVDGADLGLLFAAWTG